MPVLRLRHFAHLALFTLALIATLPEPITASVFGQEHSSSSSTTTLNLKLPPAKRQSAPKSGTSQRLGRRSKKAQTSITAKKDYSGFLCPAGTVSCPVLAEGVRGLDGRELTSINPKEMDAQLNSLADWFRIGFQCVDAVSELTNCGGCASLGTGQNCTAIPDSHRVLCDQGACRVLTCNDGFTVNADKQSCISRPGPGSNGGFQLDNDEEEMVLLPRH